MRVDVAFSDTAELHVACALNHAKVATYRILAENLKAVTSNVLHSALAIIIKNPLHSTYRSETFSHHWAKRFQITCALKRAALSCAASAAETVTVAVAVSALTLHRPLFAPAYEFTRRWDSCARQLFDECHHVVSVFSPASPAVGDVEHAAAVCSRPITDLTTAVVACFVDPDRCIHNAVEELLEGSPKHLKNLPEFVGLVSASGAAYLAYTGYSRLKLHMPLVEAAAQRYKLHDCNALLCLSRLAMRIHGFLAITLAGCSSALDGDGDGVEYHLHNPGVYKLRVLVAEMRRHVAAAGHNRLAVLHGRMELQLVLRFACRLHRAVQRCVPHVSAVLSSATMQDIRDRLVAAAARDAAAAAAAADEQYFIMCSLYFVECFAHIERCISVIPSLQQLKCVLSVADMIALFNGRDVYSRPCALFLPVVHELRQAPWLRDDSLSIAQLSWQLMSKMSASSPVFFVLREILFDRSNDFQRAVLHVVGSVDVDAANEDSSEILVFFNQLLLCLRRADGVVSPLAEMIGKLFLQVVTHGMRLADRDERDVSRWLSSACCRELAVHLLRRARDVDVPLRLFGICAHVALKFILDVTASCSPVFKCHPRILGCLNRAACAAASLQLLHPDWSFLKAFDLYRIAISTMIYALQHGRPPSSSNASCKSPAHCRSLFKLGDATKNLSLSQSFYRNRAFAIIVRRALSAADAAHSQSRLYGNAFWTDDVRQCMQHIENIVRAYIPADSLSPLSVKHPIIAHGQALNQPNNAHILRMLKNYNDSLHSASQVDLFRVQCFFRRCDDLLRLSRQKRSLAAALFENGRQQAAAAAARDSSLAQHVLAEALAEKGAWVVRIVEDVYCMMVDISQSFVRGFRLPQNFMQQLLLSYPETASLSQSSVTIRQVIEVFDSVACVMSYYFQQRQHRRYQRCPQQQHELWLQYERWHRHQQRLRRHLARHRGSRDLPALEQLRAEPVRRVDINLLWFMFCDVMRICGEGANLAQLHQQQQLDDGFLRSILHFADMITGHSSEHIATRADSGIRTSRGGLPHAVLAPHLAELIIERPQVGLLLRCGLEFLRILGNIELHFNVKIPVVMMDRIVGELLAICPDEHSHVYDLLNAIGRRELFDGVKHSYNALSVEILAMGAFAAVVAATLLPFNVVLTQLYFDDNVAQRADIVPLAYPFAFTFGTAGTVGSGLLLFVKQCQSDSAIGELDWRWLTTKLVAAALAFWIFGYSAGRALESQDVFVEFFTSICLMLGGIIAAVTVFVRNLTPVLRYGSKLVGL